MATHYHNPAFDYPNDPEDFDYRTSRAWGRVPTNYPHGMWSDPAIDYSPGTWSTATGRVLNIADMSTDHLINTAALLWRTGAKAVRGLNDANPEFCRKKLNEFLAELKFRRERDAN